LNSQLKIWKIAWVQEFIFTRWKQVHLRKQERW